jgi:hypothetical protein
MINDLISDHVSDLCYLAFYVGLGITALIVGAPIIVGVLSIGVGVTFFSPFFG